MNRMLLILRHEFLHVIKRPWFVVLTLSLPALAIVFIGITRITARATQPPAEAIQVGYVDQVGGLSQFTGQGNISLIRFDSAAAARQALIQKQITDYVVIPANFIATGVVELYTMQQELSPSGATIGAVTNFIAENLLAGKVPPDVITRVETPLTVVTTTLTSSGAAAPQQAGTATVVIAGVFSLLLALSLAFSSTYLLQSFGEEKENRLMEVLLSSVSTRQLLAGKVLGLGAAGLLQVVVWIICLPFLLRAASPSASGLSMVLQVPVAFRALGVVYFILGYLQFGVLSASVAAVSPSTREAQAIAALYMVPNVAPLWFLSLIVLYPASPAWVVLSFFPFTAPVLTMLRLGLFGVPAWQLATSLAVLGLSVIGGLLLAARLLKAFVLMYGKRPTLREIGRNLRSG